jgi:hypothetical protein
VEHLVSNLATSADAVSGQSGESDMNKSPAVICEHAFDKRKCCDLPTCKYCEECGMGGHTNFIERVTNWLDEGNEVRMGLAINGPMLIAEATRTISLRELSRRTGFSPTYLSMVMNAKVTISPEAYVKIACMELGADRPALAEK